MTFDEAEGKLEIAENGFVAGKDVSEALNAARAGAWRLIVREDRLDWEPPLNEILRETMPGFTGSEESFLACIHADDIEMVREVIREAKKTGGEFECEFRLALSNKGRWMQMRGSSSTGEDLTSQLSGIGFEVTQKRNSDFRFEAFYQLCSSLTRVTRLEEVFDAAIDAITRILNADRASILLFDDDDVLRFRSWRNLSDNYRAQVERHTPWTRSTERPQPITVSVVSEETLGHLAPIVLEEGIQSLAFVPLTSKSGLLGKFMVYFDQPREFTPMDMVVAETIAGHVSYAIERQVADEAQSRLATIVANSDDAIVSKSLEGKILSWNAGAERIFGYSAEEAVGSSMALIVPKDRWSEEESILARLRQGQRIDHFETIRRSKSGKMVPVSITVSPIRDSTGQIVGASKIARDIQDLRRSKEVLESLVRIGARFSSTLEPERLLEMLLEEAGQLTGARCGTAGVFDGDSLAAVVKIDEDGGVCRESPELVFCEEHPEGCSPASFQKLLQAEVAGGEAQKGVVTPILNSTHQLIGAFALQEKKDGTTFDQGEIELLHAIANAASPALQNALTYRQQQLTEQRLKDADDRKNEFLATLAHELRNPLAPIQTSVNLLQLKRNESHDLSVATSVIERQVKQMARLIDDLMDVSRITRGRIQLRTEPVSVDEVLREAIEMSKPLMEKQGHALEVTLESNAIVEGDGVRLTQVFGNILNNAAKYTEAGGMIRVKSKMAGEFVEVSVKDNGIGIHPDTLPGIFEMFAQETPALSRSQGGLGIGLWLVRQLVELHGGSIRASSPGPNLGSTFTILLPASS